MDCKYKYDECIVSCQKSPCSDGVEATSSNKSMYWYILWLVVNILVFILTYLLSGSSSNPVSPVLLGGSMPKF